MATSVSSKVAAERVRPPSAAEPTTEAPAAKPAPSQRLISLDAFRGFTMFWIIGGGSLMLGFQGLGGNPVADFIVYHLHHTPWQGLRYYDVIWPCFMLMVGMSLPFSYAKRSLTQSHSQMMRHAIQRTVVLFLLGSLRTSVDAGSPLFIELSSALQPIAVAYFVAFLLVRRSLKFQAAAGGAILVGYALLLEFVAGPGVSAGSYQQGANLVLAVDLAVLGRAHPEGWGTVLSTIPTISTTILGLWLGGILKSDRPAKSKVKVIAAVGASGVAIGLALDPVIPVVMKLWTTSYGILTAGWACLLFLLFYWIIDIRGFRAWAFPFVVIGANAVAIYMSRTLIPWNQTIGIFTGGIAEVLGAFGPLFKAICVLLAEWCVLFWMYKRKIFLKA